MATWQIAILLLAIVWALQSVGVWMQMRHYRSALGDIEQKFASGYVGTGFTRGRFAKGTIALVVVNDRLTVDRVAVMSGRSVFAKFHNHTEFEGLSLTDLKERAIALSEGAKDERSLGKTLLQACEQIDAVRAKKTAMSADVPSGTAPNSALSMAVV